MRNVLGACEPEADVSSLVGTHEFAPTSQYPDDKVKTLELLRKPDGRQTGKPGSLSDSVLWRGMQWKEI
jgi:hypothetical protein